ncbi:MAG: hypothetical protein L0H93_20495 [Nocardioides sp.]|nr:hypothetical protein [Nocardioides sp.]
MVADWLTLKDVAETVGVQENTVRRRVAAGKFPAPHRFLGRDGSGPVWPADSIEDPMEAPGLPSRVGTQGMDREMHLAHLLDEVRWYVWEHGSAAIPQHATGRSDSMGRKFPLGVRVSALRGARKHGRLTAAEAAEFDMLPEWSWDHWDSIWRERFGEVVVRFHSGRLTSRDRAWLGNQRRRWGKLRPEWQAMLAQHPGLLEGAKQSRVEEFVEACEHWLADHPDHTLYAMPYAASVTIEGEKVSVGRRATYYRRRYQGLEGRRPLSEADIKTIEQLPGWTWEMSPVHVQAQRKNKSKKTA